MLGSSFYRVSLLCFFSLALIACDGSTGTNPVINTESSGNKTGNATLSWQPPTENSDGSILTDLNGYIIYYGQSPDSMANIIIIDNPNLSSYVIENLTVNSVYYFVLKAINIYNIESDFSNIASKNISD